MRTYFIRTADPAAMIALGLLLGALEPLDGGGVKAAQGGTWTHVGHLPDRSNQTGTDELGQPVYDVLRDAQGRPLEHYNLLTPLDLADVAAELAQSSPAIAGALSRVPEFFVTDEQGRARAPRNPALTFWGAAPEGSTT